MIIEIEGTKKQEQMFSYINHNDVREILYGGAAGSAKSFGISLLMINLCIQYDGIRIGLARNDLSTLKKTTIISFYEAIDHLKDEYGIQIDFKYNSVDGKITFANSSVIQLYELKYLPSDPEYTRLGGALLTLAVIDEVGEVDERGYNIFKSRINRWRNNKLRNNFTGEVGIVGQLYMTCNPVKGWLYNEFYKKHTENRLEPNKIFIQALPTDNPFLPEEYIKTLSSLPMNQRQRLLYGNWDYDDNPNAMISYDDIINIYSNDNEWVNTDNEWYITADIAFTSDKLVIMVWNGFEVVEIFAESKQEEKPEDLIKKYIQKYQVKYSNVIYDSDGVGKYLKNYLMNAVAMINNGKPFKDENYQNLKTQLAYKLAEYINNNKIRIRDYKFKELIEEELGQLLTKPDKDVGKIKIVDKNTIKMNIGRSPDFLDTMIYRMYYIYTNNSLPSFSYF